MDKYIVEDNDYTVIILSIFFVLFVLVIILIIRLIFKDKCKERKNLPNDLKLILKN